MLMSSNMLSGERILCVFPDTWGDLKRGRHQIIGRLLATNEIMVIEEPMMSVLSLFREKKRIRRLWSWLRIRQPEKNLFLYTPVLVLPFMLRSEFIRKISQFLLWINIWVVLKFSKFRPTLLYLCIPSVDGFINCFGINRSVYVAHDAWEVYPEGCQLARDEERTLTKVGLAIFNAKPNMERKLHMNQHSYYIPHGCPVPDLHPASCVKPTDFPQTGELFLGYWGFIDKGSVDIDLLMWLSQRHPEWTFVLVGAIYQRDQSDFASLKGRDNIIFLGQKKQEERYDYLRYFNLALLCACPTEIELKASQLKFWEYASIGLPVVGIPVEEYKGYDWFYAAQTNLEWEEMINRAINDDTTERRRSRIEFAMANTWERRVAQISALVQQVLPTDYQ
jgi:glycosyltransferase involved in cell wall biosynthesis